VLGSAQALPRHRLPTGAAGTATWWAFKGRSGSGPNPGRVSTLLPAFPWSWGETRSCKYLGSEDPTALTCVPNALIAALRHLAGGVSFLAFAQTQTFALFHTYFLKRNFSTNQQSRLQLHTCSLGLQRGLISFIHSSNIY
jgi:hypothetical protein